MHRMLVGLWASVLLGPAGLPGAVSAAPVDAAGTAAHRLGEYRAIQERLASGWNTWNTRSITSHVLLPEGLAFNLAFKQHYWLEERYLAEPLIGRYDDDAERIRPGLHAYDGGYTDLTLEWEQIRVRIESGRDGDDLIVLITPSAVPSSPAKLVVESALLWNRPGSLSREGDTLLAELPERRVELFSTSGHRTDPYVPARTPYLALPLTDAVGLSTGRARDVGEIRSLLDRQRATLENEAAAYGELAEAYLAIQAGIAWNLIYEPRHDRVVSTVGRLWNKEYGGFCLFGWDNFFLAYMTSLSSRDLAYANVIEHLRGKTEEGFIPNDNRGNGSKSWDRSQPPVGSLMVREIYKRYPERWFLEATFDDLLAWNRWWLRRRVNDGLLAYGSHEAKNPFDEPAVQTKKAAGYESGMDDSPMYEDVPFNRDKGTLELQDVGLNSLFAADSLALADMARVLGRGDVEHELRARAAELVRRMETLWHEPIGLYLNRRIDTGELSTRLSPTLFYPLLGRIPSAARSRRIVEEHLLNPEEFWGEYILPSTARNDPSFPRQRYWKGAIWPPLNFLTYLALRQYGFEKPRRELADKSLAMFLHEWRRKGYVSENYSSITGTGDDQRLSSDRFHSWGALFGFMAFIEEGFMPAPEADID